MRKRRLCRNKPSLNRLEMVTQSLFAFPRVGDFLLCSFFGSLTSGWIGRVLGTSEDKGFRQREITKTTKKYSDPRGKFAL